jgi:hypothetical protein
MSPTPSPTDGSGNNLQVFNIGNNIYTYDEAQAVCKAFDSDLADYDQIEQAYQSGGEWCNYGWSKGQMAYFPTQKNTWNALQNDPNTKNACGRPGINGGFIANPHARFGANCYGVKPPKPAGWTPNVNVANIITATATPTPTVNKEMEKLRKNAYLNAFNQATGEWSEYYGITPSAPTTTSVPTTSSPTITASVPTTSSPTITASVPTTSSPTITRSVPTTSVPTTSVPTTAVPTRPTPTTLSPQQQLVQQMMQQANQIDQSQIPNIQIFNPYP